MIKSISCCILATVLLPAAQSGLAQPAGWSPDGNVEIVSGVAPGGGTDVTARLLRKMLERLQPAIAGVVVNKPGGGGTEGWAYLDSLTGSSRHIAISTPVLLTNHITRSDRLTYTDFTPITNLYSEYVLVAVRADSPLKTGRDLIARLREDASSVSLAMAPALGGHNHIALALVARAAGGDPGKLRVELYKTGPEAARAAIEGRADVVSSTAGTLLAEVLAGKLRPLGMTSGRRLGGPFAAVPTWKEQGVDVVLPTWRGVVGPRGMTGAQIAYWEGAFLKLSFQDEWLEEIRKRWWDGTYLNSAETRAFLAGQYGLLKRELTGLGLAR